MPSPRRCSDPDRGADAAAHEPAQIYRVPQEVLELLTSSDAQLEEKLIDVAVTPSNCVRCGAITNEGRAPDPSRGGDRPCYEIEAAGSLERRGLRAGLFSPP